MSDKQLGTTVALPGVSDLKAMQMLQTYPQWMDQIWKNTTLSEGLVNAISQNTNIPDDLAEIIHSYGIIAIEFIKKYYQLRIRIQSGIDEESAKEELRDIWNTYRYQIPIAHFYAKNLNSTVDQVLLGLERKDQTISRVKDRKAKLLEYQLLPTYLETTKVLTPWVEMDHPIANKIIEQVKTTGVPSDVYSYRLELFETLDTTNLPETYPKLLEITNDRLQKWYENGYLEKALLEITEYEDVLTQVLKESGLTYNRLTELLGSAKELEQLRPYLHILRVMEAVEERFKPRFDQISIEVQLKMFLKNELTDEDLRWLRGIIFENQSDEDRLQRLRTSDQEILDKLVEYWAKKQTIQDESSLGGTKSEEDSALTEKFAGKILNFVIFHPLSTLKLITELFDWISVHVSDIGIEIRSLKDQYRRILRIGNAISELVKEIQYVCPDMDSDNIRAILHSAFMGERYTETLEKLPSTNSTLIRVTFGEDCVFQKYSNLVVSERWWPVALETLINFEEKVSGIRSERLLIKKEEFDSDKAYISVASMLIKRISSLGAQALSGANQTFVLPGFEADFSIRKALNPLMEIERKTRAKPQDVFNQVLVAEVPMPMGTQTVRQIIVSDVFQNDEARYNAFIRSTLSQSHILDMCEHFSSEIISTLIGNMLVHYERLGDETVLEVTANEYVTLLRQVRIMLRSSERDDWGNVMASLVRFTENVDRAHDKAQQFRTTPLSQLANYIIQPSKFLQNVLKDMGFGRKGIIAEYVEKTLKEAMTLQRLLRRSRLIYM